MKEGTALAIPSRNPNQTKTFMFMLTTAASVILLLVSLLFIFKYFKSKQSLKECQTQLAEKPDMSEFAHEVPHGRVKLNTELGRLTAQAGGVGGRAYEIVYTIDPNLQRKAETVLREFGGRHNLGATPYMGVIVGIEPDTGAVRVMASYESRRKQYFDSRPFSGFLEPLARDSNYPMASVQKIITAAAAMETDGKYKPTMKVKKGRQTFAQAMAKSQNDVFTSVARDISVSKLQEYYRKFDFNRSIRFDLPLAESVFTNTPGAGSGLNGARISPLHAALIAAAIKNNGVMMQPYVVEKVRRGGRSLNETEPEELTRPIKPETAKQLARMMSGTVRKGGTAYNGFGKNIEALEQIDDTPRFIAKTGTVADSCQTNDVTWFVGYTDKDHPDLAFAVLFTVVSTRNLHAVHLAWDFFEARMNAAGKIPKNDR